MRHTYSLIMAALGAVNAAASFGQSDACSYAQQAFSVGTKGCFKGTLLECIAHNEWKASDACTNNSIPGGGTAFSPDDFEGVLCEAGGSYSPGAELCMTGVYQSCQPTGTFREVSPPIDYTGCR